LAQHILDGVFYATEGVLSDGEASREDIAVAKRLKGVILEGIKGKSLQRLPHLVLLNKEWYHQRLVQPMASWIWRWLRKQPELGGKGDVRKEWVTIWRNGDYCVDPETVQEMAKKSDRIWIRKANDHEYGCKSKPNGWPIDCMRAGKAPSKPLTGGDASMEKVVEGWEGPQHALQHLWNQGVPEYPLARGQMIYHACCNAGGAHLGQGHCTFIYGQQQEVEVLLEVANEEEEERKTEERKEGAMEEAPAIAYITGDRAQHAAGVQNQSPRAMQLLNLSHDWLASYLPHNLSKVNRVSFGILQPEQLARADPRTPKSRRLLAVPFVGKDRPSGAAEFAHPDILIGLTVLAYRYEGLRLSDIHATVSALKADIVGEPGPLHQRPSRRLFDGWLAASPKPKGNLLPLELFQPGDPVQLRRLWDCIRSVPPLVKHYCQHHVFPKCLLQQKTKMSASGQELGAPVLFHSRIGFSGTPSELLPTDLKPCVFEPGSEGRIVAVLSDPGMTSVEVAKDWTVESVLKSLATADPPLHALIDVGAVITGLTNEQVARGLLQHGLDHCEGCVFLDDDDRQMILFRGDTPPVPLATVGLPRHRRFTFYDQVHTTGIDIKQSLNARAAITVSKDTSLRDYAQGAWRMRGIAAGQTLHLVLIEEVKHLIIKAVGEGSSVQADTVAWLLVNEMRVATMQAAKLSEQSLLTVYRKHGLAALLDTRLGGPVPPSSGPCIYWRLLTAITGTVPI